MKSSNNAIVMNGFVVKNENTKTNGIAIQPNKMQKGLERWNIEEKRGAANENDHGTHGMPKEINRWNVAEQCGVANENNPGKQKNATGK